MPQDARGNELNVGDEVVVRFKVTGVLHRDRYCNVSLEAVRVPDGEHQPAINCNSAITLKVNPRATN